MMKQKKNSLTLPSPSLLKRKSIGQQIETRKNNLIRDHNIDQLKQLFAMRDNIMQSSHNNNSLPLKTIQSIIEIIDRAQITFLMELSNKICLEDYQQFIGSLKLISRQEDTFMIEKGKKPSHFSILIQGSLLYHIESELNNELICVGEAEPGHLIYPQVFMTPKYVNYSIYCQENCQFLTFNEEMYNKHLKKILIREADQMVSFLNRTTLFDGLGSLTLRKYLSYFIPKTYKYNQIIYESGTEAKNIEMIIEGQVQLFSKTNGNSIGLVKLSKGECFGVQCIDSLIRKYDAKSIQSKVKVLCLDLSVLTMIQMENIIVMENYQKFINRIDKLHNSILTKNIKVLNNQDSKPVTLRKKKKVKGRKKKNLAELKWWGLAQNVKADHKYRVPNVPNFQQTCSRRLKKNDSNSSPNILFAHKIVDLRRRVLENDLQDYENECEQIQQKENMEDGWITTKYVPKMRKKIQMLDTKPKAINMVEVVKKKLLTYAKNMGSFCDRLNLQ